MDSDWPSIIRTIIGAGIGSALVSACVQILFPVIRDYRQRKKQAAYMAMRLAVVLENFAWACANFVQDNHNAEEPQDEEYPAWSVVLPEIGAYPDDGDGWRAIDRKLAGRCLGLRNRVQESQSEIRGISYYIEERLGETLDEQAAKRGLDAWKLAVDLRKKHGVEEIKPEWEYGEYLENTLKSVEEMRRKREESDAKSDLWNKTDRDGVEDGRRPNEGAGG